MEFIETLSFTSRLHSYLSEESYARFQSYLSQHPDRGEIIPGTKGLRKIRWGSKGRGKRAGVRVIYYWYVNPAVITLLDIYLKNQKDDLSKAELRLLRLTLEN